MHTFCSREDKFHFSAIVVGAFWLLTTSHGCQGVKVRYRCGLEGGLGFSWDGYQIKVKGVHANEHVHIYRETNVCVDLSHLISPSVPPD